MGFEIDKDRTGQKGALIIKFNSKKMVKLKRSFQVRIYSHYKVFVLWFLNLNLEL